jgi:hypothetical protein
MNSIVVGPPELVVALGCIAFLLGITAMQRNIRYKRAKWQIIGIVLLLISIAIEIAQAGTLPPGPSLTLETLLRDIALCLVFFCLAKGRPVQPPFKREKV